MRELGTESEERSAFIHDLKIRLTAISGYAQLLERHIQENQRATPKQRDYVARVRRLIAELTETINEYDREHRSKPQQDSQDENGPTSPHSSQCMSR